MLAASADRRTIGVVEPNISVGPFHYYDVATGELRFIRNTDRFLFEVAVNRDGSQFVVPTHEGFQQYERVGDAVHGRQTIGSPNSGALAAVFSPVADVLFTSRFAPTGD
jgi:hypothetical protein